MSVQSATIKIVVNGDPLELPEKSALSDLLSQLKLRPELVVVELNLNILKREQVSQTTLKEGDQLEIVHFVGGGASTAPGRGILHAPSVATGSGCGDSQTRCLAPSEGQRSLSRSLLDPNPRRMKTLPRSRCETVCSPRTPSPVSPEERQAPAMGEPWWMTRNPAKGKPTKGTSTGGAGTVPPRDFLLGERRRGQREPRSPGGANDARVGSPSRGSERMHTMGVQ